MSALDCHDIRDAFLAGRIPSSSEVEAHVRECPRCTELLADHARLGRGLAVARREARDTEELLTVSAPMMPARSGFRIRFQELETNRRRLVVLVAALALGLLTVATGLRHSWAGESATRTGVTLSLYAGGLGLSVWAAVRSMGRPRRPRLTLAMAIGFLAVPLVIAIWPPAEIVLAGSGFERSIRSCFMYGSLLAVPFSALIWFLTRESRMEWETAASTTAAMGLIANVGLLLHCPITDPWHVVLGHATIGPVWFVLWAMFNRFSSARQGY